jgi:hypothetical protein
VGRLRPETLRHILIPSRIDGRSIPELSMAFRGDHAVRADHAGFAGLLSIAALSILDGGGHGGFREPVLLAGTPEDIAALEQSFSPEQKTLVEVVDRIDITRQPISALVQRMHRHAVSWGISAAGHPINEIEEGWSLGLDLKILLRTIPAVITGSGAK